MNPRALWIPVLLASVWCGAPALAVTTSDKASKAPVSKAVPPPLSSSMQSASGAANGRTKLGSSPAAADQAAPKKK